MLIQADKEVSTIVLEKYHGLAKASLLLEEYQAAENFFFELKNPTPANIIFFLKIKFLIV